MIGDAINFFYLKNCVPFLMLNNPNGGRILSIIVSTTLVNANVKPH